MLVTTIIALLSIWSAHAQCPGHSVGEFWANGKIKMQCTAEGSRPVACLPDAKLDGKVLEAGQYWSNDKFKAECKANGPLGLSFNIIACLLPNGTEMAIGSQVGVSNKGIYICVQDSTTGLVSRKLQSGCFFNGKLYSASQSWSSGNSQITCESGNGFYEAKARGCLITGKAGRQNEIVPLGDCAKVENAYYKCKANGKIAYQADFVQIAENEYREWAKSNGEDEEEAASGGSASGQTIPPTTTTTTTHAPTTTTTKAPTTTPEPTTTKAPVTCPPAPATVAPAPQGGCQDSLPICKTLCSRQCNDQQQYQGNNQQQNYQRPQYQQQQHHDSESVGLANNKRGLNWGWDLLFSNGQASSRGNNGAKLGGNYGGGGGWNSGSGGAGGGGGWGQWGGGGGWGGQGGNYGQGGHSGGRPGGHSGGKPGKGHGNGKHSHSGSWEKPKHTTRYPVPTTTFPPTMPPTEPPMNNPACSEMADLHFELISAFCPKSCGACDKQMDLDTIAAKYNSANCVAKNPIQEEAVGLAARKGGGKKDKKKGK